MGLRLTKKMGQERTIEQVLVEEGLLTAADLNSAKLKALTKNQSLTEVLLADALISDLDLAKAFAGQSQLDYIDLTNLEISPATLSAIPRSAAEKYHAIPVQDNETTLTIALQDPAEIIHLEKFGHVAGKKIEFKIAPAGQIVTALQKFYSKGGKSEAGAKSAAKPEIGQGKQRSVVLDQGRPGIEELVNQIIESCITHRASDIHLEPEDQIVRVRARIDGVLHQLTTFKIDNHHQVISRLKILAGLDIAEKRNAQDGSFKFEGKSKTVDLRLSTLPTMRGEKAALRILDKSVLSVKLDDLGMSPPMLESLRRILDTPHGLVLLTGPTGSGKTTTVYSMLNHINSIERNIITVEDPVEYQLGIINQVQVNNKAGLSFAGILRNILRQDPDVIMVGEIRDKETADLSVRASLTGHLVISTIHTNDAISTVTRLCDMGIEPFLVSSSLAGIVSQRLVRTLCVKCKTPQKFEAAELAAISPAFANLKEATVYNPKGCPACYGSGFAGRQPIFELLIPTPPLRKIISANVSPDELSAQVASTGFTTMRADGFARVLAGQTSLDEVIKATV